MRSVSDAYTRGEIGLAEARGKLKTFFAGHGYKGDDVINKKPPAGVDPDEWHKARRISNLASTARLNLILNQNASMARAAGSYKRGLTPHRVKRFPYWVYLATTSREPREEHSQYVGRVYRKDDPVWQYIFPPNGFGCRCRVREIDAQSAEEKYGGVMESNEKDYHEPPDSHGFIFDPAEPFNNFDLKSVKSPDIWNGIAGEMKERFAINIPFFNKKNEREPELKASPEMPTKTEKMPRQTTNVPAGTPVSETVEIKMDNEETKAATAHAISVVNKVHGVDNLPQKVPICDIAPVDNADAEFVTWVKPDGQKAALIKIKSGLGNTEITAVHEIGHFIDEIISSSSDPRIVPLIDGLKNALVSSVAYSKIEKSISEVTDDDVKGYFKYLGKVDETMARAYLQYITVKSDDKILMKQLDKIMKDDYNKIYNAQWEAEDFRPIFEAFEKLLKAKGWIL